MLEIISSKFKSFNLKSNFQKNFISVLSASILGQCLNFCFIPILTRIYSPENFGEFSLLTSFSSIILSFSTFKFDWLIPNSKNKSEGASLFILGVFILFITSILISFIFFIIYIFAPDILSKRIINQSSFFSLIFILLPLIFLGQGLGSLLKGWHTGNNELSKVAKSTFFQSVVKNTISIISGFSILKPFGLIFAFTISIWSSLIILNQNCRELYIRIRNLKKIQLKITLKKYKKEVFWSLLVSIFNTLSTSFPLLLLAAFYSIKEIGWYSLNLSIAAGPLSIVTSSLSHSYWANAANLYKNKKYKELKRHYIATSKKLAITSIPIGLIFISGPLFVGPIFGKEDWTAAGYMLALMTPKFIGSIIFSPTNHLVVFGKQSKQLYADLFRISLISLSILTCHIFNYSIFVAVATMSLSSFAGHYLLYYIHIKEHKNFGL